ncbi:hypothetical protein [Nocardia miyunensis]|uniref:hypothetical protein n=1 Tax=Nocardia miyunensis TaxID=282684 RepID=UPI00082FC3E5|nr:hypothetical protein [Nocardia miyunensis]
MTTLADEGWTPVTAERYESGYAWRVWCDPNNPDWTYIEARNEAGRVVAGGIGGQREPDEGVRFWVSKDDGFPTFVGVRFPAEFPSIEIETTHRALTVEAEQTQDHFGMRYYAMPLEDDEELFAVTGGGERERYIPALVVGSGETGFYPSER